MLEKSRQKELTQELVQGVKKAQRDAKKDPTDASVCQPAQATEPVVLEQRAENSTDSRCAVCGEGFPSRTKMFQHIKATGHAALKEAPPADRDVDGRKKGKKKR